MMQDNNIDDDNNTTTNNENDELLKWNLLQLETKEILSECHFHTNNDDNTTTSTSSSNLKTLINIKQYIQNITSILDKLPSHKSLTTLANSNDNSNNNCIYLKSDLYKKFKSKWEVQYDKSTMFDSIETIGSYNNGSMTTTFGNGNLVPTIDLCVFLHSDKFWKEKDYLNHRYFDKRNLMLLHIAQYLSKKKFISKVGDVQLSYFRGDVRKLVLLVSPPTTSTSNSNKRSKFQIRIVLGSKSFPFPYSRLYPNCNNLPKDSVKPTVLYNHAMIEDMSFITNQELLTNTLHQHQSSSITNNFEESLTLLKVWCSVHGLRNTPDALSSFEITMILLHCYRTKRVSRGMTLLQVFSSVLHFMRDLFAPGNTKRHIIMPGHDNENQTACAQEELYQQEYKNQTLLKGYIKSSRESNGNEDDIPIFLTTDRTMNLFSRLSSSSCKLIHHHANHTCKSKKTWNVHDLFIQQKRFWNIFDFYLHIPHFHYKEEVGENKSSMIPFNATDLGSKEEYTLRCIVYILSKALNDRIVLLRPYTTGNGCTTTTSGNKDSVEDVPTWSYNDKPPKVTQYIIGVQFSSSNSDALSQMVDKCCDLNKKDLFTFLFRDRIELRRFRDGTIHPSVLWQSPATSTTSNRYLGVTKEILNHLFSIHFKQVKYTLHNSKLLSFIEGPPQEYDSMILSKQIIHAFDALSLSLMNHHTNSDNMPLSIDSVDAVSPMLRYSSLFPSTPHPQLGASSTTSYNKNTEYSYTATSQEPITIQISFQQGVKAWPRDVNAIQAAKCAMLLTLANTIEYARDVDEHYSYQSFQGDITVSSTHLDLGYKGYSWRIIIKANEEMKVLKQLQVPTSEAIQLHKQLYVKHILDPTHHSTIHALHTKHPSASGTVRLIQRWLASHLISTCNSIPLHVLELLVAYVYIHYSHSLHSVPSTPILGFTRFLHFMSTFDFQHQPILINFAQHDHDDDDMNDNNVVWYHKDILQIQNHFKSMRGEDYSSGPPCYIVTSVEYNLLQKDSSLQHFDHSDWLLSSFRTNNNKPERIVWNRMIELAKRCYSFTMNPLLLSTQQQRSCPSSDLDVTLPMFQETPESFQKYHALFRINTDLVFDTSCSSTATAATASDDYYSFQNSIDARSLGPKMWRSKRMKYKNLSQKDGNDQSKSIVHGWEPIQEFISHLQSKYSKYCLFFYNQYTPHVIGILFRPNVISTTAPRNISALNCYYKRPLYNDDNNEKNYQLSVTNIHDILREIQCIGRDIIVDVKLLIDDGRPVSKKLKSEVGDDSDDDDDSSSSNSSEDDEN